MKGPLVGQRQTETKTAGIERKTHLKIVLMKCFLLTVLLKLWSKKTKILIKNTFEIQKNFLMVVN